MNARFTPSKIKRYTRIVEKKRKHTRNVHISYPCPITLHIERYSLTVFQRTYRIPEGEPRYFTLTNIQYVNRYKYYQPRDRNDNKDNRINNSEYIYKNPVLKCKTKEIYKGFNAFRSTQVSALTVAQ